MHFKAGIWNGYGRATAYVTGSKGKIQIIKIPERLQTGERYENSGSPVAAAGYFKEWIAQEIEREEGNEKGMP